MKKSVFVSSVLQFFLGSACAVAVSTAAYAQEADNAKITFEQIFENPDDHALNLQYARQQAKIGDLLSAASALERMLYAQPNWDSARLFYALVLYKLDDRPAAIRELDLLANRPLSASQSTQLDAYRNNFSRTVPEQQASTAEFSGRLSIFAQYDDNAGNALTDNFVTVVNQGDISLNTQLSLRLSAPISQEGDVKFRAGFRGQSKRHETFSAVDYDDYAGNAGLEGRAGTLTWLADVEVRQVNISGEKYLTEVGARVTLRKAIAEQTHISLSGRFIDQDHDDFSTTFGEINRSGDKFTINAGIRHTASPKLFVGAAIQYENKDAVNPNFGYTGWRLNGDFRSTFEGGAYLTGYASYRILDYGSAVFGGVTPPERNDDHIYGRLALGASFATIGRWMNAQSGGKWENLYLETALHYRNRDSSIASFDYDNFGAELRLIWDF